MTDEVRPEVGLDELDTLLTRARDADPGARINLRDQIAAHGDLAIEAMTDWLGDARLAAFAIRVLERIGLAAASRSTVLDAFWAVDRDELAPYLVRDLEEALRRLGATAARRTRSRTSPRRPQRPRAIGQPGLEGRGYWVMRTSPWERPFIWSEAQGGRLRQGWGWDESQNLEAIAATVRRGGELSDLQKLAWPARRMRTTAPDGIRFGDIVVAPNVPAWGQLSIFRVTGSYTWAPEDIGVLDRFGHVLPVELLVGDVDRRAPEVSDALRSMLRPQSRLYSIRDHGGDVESVIAANAQRLAGRDSGDA
jgi:hypothetical protein